MSKTYKLEFENKKITDTIKFLNGPERAKYT